MKLKVLFVLAIFLVGCGDEIPLPTIGSQYEAHCKEPLPVFTLGEYSNPTKAQEEKLCACIWESLSGWEREVSEKISQGKESEVSAMHLRAFPPRFGDAI